MTQELQFVVHGPPVPKARARTVRAKTGKTVSYTPKKTASHESTLATYALQARCKVSRWPYADKSARFGVAIRVYKSRDQGDLDNFEKSVMDACNRVLWHDDKQVIRRGDGGMYECAKGQERTEVRVWIVEANPCQP